MGAKQTTPVFSFPAVCQVPLAGLALKDVSKRWLCFSRKKKKNLYFEVKKEALLPLNTSLKQEDVVVSIILFSFRISLFFSDAHIRILLPKVQITVIIIYFFFIIEKEMPIACCSIYSYRWESESYCASQIIWYRCPLEEEKQLQRNFACFWCFFSPV